MHRLVGDGVRSPYGHDGDDARLAEAGNLDHVARLRLDVEVYRLVQQLTVGRRQLIPESHASPSGSSHASFALIFLVVVVIGGAAGWQGISEPSSPSATALADIPVEYLSFYEREAATAAAASQAATRRGRSTQRAQRARCNSSARPGGPRRLR